jgi:hypothetical protein
MSTLYILECKICALMQREEAIKNKKIIPFTLVFYVLVCVSSAVPLVVGIPPVGGVVTALLLY